MRLLEALAGLLGATLLLVLALQRGDGGAQGLAPGLEELRRLAEAGEHQAALELGESLLAPTALAAWRRELELGGSRFAGPALDLADPALDLLRLSGPTRRERAHVHYALGAVQLELEQREAAAGEFRTAHVRAGAGELRLDAAYNLGTLALEDGEQWRARIPELGGQPPAPAQPPAPPAPGARPAAEQEPPDPLEQARAAYLAALEHYVGRLRLDWRDADTRANTELVLRRLRELEEIEREREEQQQEQQQEQNEEQQDPSQSEEQQENQEQQQDSDEEQSEQQQEEQQQEQEQPEEPEEQEQEPQQAEPQEVYLTKEEAQRLLDKLKEHEEQGEELKERRRAQRHRPTARDW